MCVPAVASAACLRRSYRPTAQYLMAKAGIKQLYPCWRKGTGKTRPLHSLEELASQCAQDQRPCAPFYNFTKYVLAELLKTSPWTFDFTWLPHMANSHTMPGGLHLYITQHGTSTKDSLRPMHSNTFLAHPVFFEWVLSANSCCQKVLREEI